jgi:hypothetical protein
MDRRRSVGLLAALAALGCARPELRMEPVARYTCYRTSQPVQIDGRLEEAAWRQAPWSAPFVDIVTGEPAWLPTRCALLWDEANLYIAFEIPEPHVRATLTERDSPIYNDNDVEVFIAGRDAYYEFEINALGTIYEVFWIWKDALRPGSPYFGRPEFDPMAQRVMTLAGVGGHRHPRGERWGFLDWDLPGLRHAVHVNGTINQDGDTDQGWSVELAFPWEGLRNLADGRPLPPNEGDVWRIDCSRFEHYGPGGERLQRAAGWTWNRHGHYDSHIPERFTEVVFSARSVAAGSADAPR